VSVFFCFTYRLNPINPAITYSPFVSSRQFQSSELFRVVVGSEETEYHLHKQTLADRCPYFTGLQSFCGIETSENKVNLPDIPVRAFKVFVTFIYANVYHVPTNLDRDVAFALHAEVYVLADRMCMTELRTLAFDRVKEEAGKGGLGFDAMAKVVEHVYDNTPDRDSDDAGVVTESDSGSTQAMRMIMVELCCFNLGAMMSRKHLPRLVRDYGDLAVDMLRRLKDLEGWVISS